MVAERAPDFEVNSILKALAHHLAYYLELAWAIATSPGPAHVTPHVVVTRWAGHDIVTPRRRGDLTFEAIRGTLRGRGRS